MEISGIILKQMEYKEADLMITVLNETSKYCVICKGANKLTSKNASNLFPFSKVSLQLNDGMNKNIYTLRSAQTIKLFHSFTSDIIRSTIASCLCEYSDYIGNEMPYEIYSLLEESLLLLDQGSNPLLILLVFMANLSHLFGIEPYVDGCVSCGSNNNICSVSKEDGGFICEDCFEFGMVKQSREFLYLFRVIHKAKIENVDKISCDDKTIRELLEFMFDFIEEHTSFYIKGKELLFHLLHS